MDVSGMQNQIENHIIKGEGFKKPREGLLNKKTIKKKIYRV